jgi:DNA repair exonuclease SbcCD nuclease subunit
MAQFVLIGDPHLDALQQHFADPYKLMATELIKPLDYARENGVKHVVWLGDVANTPTMSYSALTTLLSLLVRYKDLEHHVILGNHDYREIAHHSFLPLMDLRKVLPLSIYTEPTTRKLEGVYVNFLPFPHHEALSAKKPAINIAHIETKGAVLENGYKIKRGIEVEVGRDVWYSGHLHTTQNQKRFYWPGTLYPLTFGEPFNKGFMHVRAKYEGDRLIYKNRFVPTESAFRLIQLPIKTRSDVSEISTDPLHLYKLYVEEGVRLKGQDLLDKPNVVEVRGFKGESELKTLVQDLPQLSGDTTEFKMNRKRMQRDLRAFLKSSSLPQKSKSRADDLLRKCLETMQNAGSIEVR